MVPEDRDEMRIEDLIKDNLDNAEKKLEIIDEAKMNLALDEFVSKEVKQAMFEATNSMLTKQQKKLLILRPNDQQDTNSDRESAHPVDEDGKEDVVKPTATRGRTAPLATASAPKRSTTKRKVDADSDDDRSEMTPIPKSRGRPRRQATSRSTYYEEEEDDAEIVEEGDEEEEEDLDEPKKPSKSTSTSVSRISQNRRGDTERFGSSYGMNDNWSEANTMSHR
jgi:hypothetical protein